MALSYEHLAILWEDGERRMRTAPPGERTAMERVVDVLVADLGRRLGGRFTSQELAQMYLRDGIDWCFDVAVKVVPGEPAAWDVGIVGNAAYARYVHRAADFGGGRRYAGDDEE
jgi:hypothetical protein